MNDGMLEFSADMQNVLFAETLLMLEATNIIVTPKAPLGLNNHIASAVSG